VTEAQVKRAAAQAAALPDAGSNSRWQFVGPSNVAGRVTDLAIDPTTSPSTVYASVGSGGVFKSTDGGNVWTPAWPTQSNQAVGALARGSDGTLYAGTGEGANPSGGGSTFMGDGLYTSHDGGATWQLSGLPDSGAFGRIVVNPDNPKEVWAAATGSLTWVSSQRGLYHSTDGGIDRVDGQHQLELLHAALAAGPEQGEDHADLRRDADGPRPGRPGHRLRRRHVDRPLGPGRRQLVEAHQPVDAR
jgi:hypothetical protein